ncbi:hypothetical protein ACOSQ4_031296 [Xanthoceras sorbifolium]
MSENMDSIKQNVQESNPFGPWMLLDKSGRNRVAGNVDKRFMGNSGYLGRNNLGNKNVGVVSNNGKVGYTQGGQFGRNGVRSGASGSNSRRGGNLNHKAGVNSNLKVVNNPVYGDNGSGVKLGRGSRFKILDGVNKEGSEEAEAGLPQERVIAKKNKVLKDVTNRLTSGGSGRGVVSSMFGPIVSRSGDNVQIGQDEVEVVSSAAGHCPNTRPTIFVDYNMHDASFEVFASKLKEAMVVSLE